MEPPSTAPSDRSTPLRCLVNGAHLRLMTGEECRAVNARIAAGNLFNRLGQRVTQPLQAGLIDDRRQWGYRLDSGIPQMLSGEALWLAEDPPPDQAHP